MCRTYIIFFFLFVVQLNAGLEKSKECDEPCQRKIKESASSKKSIKAKTTSPESKLHQDIPTDVNALKESIKSRMMTKQTYKNKLEQIKSTTSQEIENQSIRDIKSIQESHFQSIQSDANEPKPIQKEESFLLNDINEQLKWKQK
jgi:hypothetical protein